jgi:hypothetical protein
MSIAQAFYKKGRKLVGDARRIVSPSALKDEINALHEEIAVAEQADAFLRGEFWAKQVEPWFKERLEELSNNLHHGRRTKHDDSMGYYEVGGFENLTDLVRFLQQLQTQKTKALERLAQIEGEMEDKQNGR